MSFQPLIFNGLLIGQSSGGGGGSGTVTAVALALPGSVFTISGSPVTTSGTLTGSLISQSANTFFAAPNGSSGTPTFRAIANTDVSGLTVANISATSNSTLTTLSSLSLPYSQITGAPAAGANTALSNLTTTSINQALLPASSGTYNFGSSGLQWESGYFAGSLTVGGQVSVGGNLTEIFGNITTPSGLGSGSASGITNLDNSGSGTTNTLVLVTASNNSATLTTGTISLQTGNNTGAGGTGNILLRTGLAGSNGGKIQFQDGSQGTSGYVWTSTDASGSGNWAAAAATGVTSLSVASSNGFAGTSSGGSTPILTLSTTITGVLKGNGTAISAATAGTDYVIPTGSITGTAANITATSNSTLITLSSLSLPYSQITGTPTPLVFSDSLVNTSGTVTLVNDSASPTASQYYGTNGSSTLGYYNLPTSNPGTVTSVGLSTPGVLYSVSGSPVTTSGILALNLISQSTNTVLAGPNGSSGNPSFRLLVPADIPILNQNTTGNAGNITATSNSTLTTLSALSLPYSQITGAPAAGITALTGDVTASGSGSVAATLATVNSNVGSFGSSTSIPTFTVNAKGLITAASGNVVIAPAGTLSGTTLNSTVVTSSLTSLGAQSAALNMNSNLINNVTNPVSAQDAATKSYVDAATAALNPTASVYAATTTNIPGTYLNGVAGVGATFTTTATGTFIVDGTTPPLNSRILIKNQSSGFQNGVYTLTTLGSSGVSAVFTRTLDYDTASDMNSAGLIPVINGTANALSSWQQIATITTVGTDSLVFQEFTANPSLYVLAANNLSDVASSSAAFNNIDPMTTTGDLIYEASAGTAARLAIGSTGNVLTVAGGLPTWAPPAVVNPVVLQQVATPTTPASGYDALYFKSDGNLYTLNSSGVETLVGGASAVYWSGYHPNGDQWVTSSTSFADPTSTGSTPSITTRKNNGLTVTQSGTTPSITFVPASTSAIYLISAKFSSVNNNQYSVFSQLTDGTTVIDAVGNSYNGTSGSGFNVAPTALSGIYIPNTTSSVTVKIQLATSNSSNQAAIDPSYSSSINTAIEWTVIQLNPGSGSNAINSQFFASNAVSTNSTAITSINSFSTFSNSPAFTFTPTVGGTYKVYSSAGIYAYAVGAAAAGLFQVANTSGAATLIANSIGVQDAQISNGQYSTVYTQAVFTLIAGTTYQFDLQGTNSASGGTIELLGSGAPFYMFAELITSGTAGAKSAIKTITTSQTLLTTDNFVKVNGSGTVTVTLPTSIAGQTYNIKNISTFTTTITPTSGTIDGSASITLPDQYSAVELVFDGTNWSIF